MTEDEKTRKKRFAAEYKVKIMDEGKKLVVKKSTEPTRKFEGKGKTPVDVHPVLKTSAEKNVREARLNELSSKTTGAYVTKATDDYVSASKNRDEKRRTKRLSGILRAHRLEKKRDEVSESVKTTNAGYGYHGTHDKSKADSEYAKAHAAIKKIVGAESKPKDSKDKKAKTETVIPDRVITHYLDSGHGKRLSGRLDDHEYVKSDFKKFRSNYDPSLFGEETLDELSNKTMKSYVDKARVSSDTGDEQTVLKRNRGVKLALARAKKRFPEKFKEETEMNEFTVEEFLEYLGGLTEDQAELELDMLDELSKKTLGKYLDTTYSRGHEPIISKERYPDQRPSVLGQVRVKRSAGMRLALRKQNGSAKVNASEEVEPIDELSKKTLGSYARKAENEKFDYDPESHKARKRDESIGLALAKIEMKNSAERGQKISDRLKKVAPKRDGYQNWPGQKKRPFRSYGEEVEPISELSGKTLASYIKKADREVENGKAGTKTGKRLSGGMLAANKLSDRGSAKIGASGWKEEISFVDQLTAVAESKGMSVVFDDGTKAAISPGTARRLLDRYETIGEDHQDEFIKKISSNLKTLRESVLR